MKTTEQIKEIVEGQLSGSDLFLVDLKISKDQHIEIFIDAEKGVNISKCSDLNRQLNEILDQENDDYSLTVSSAGIGYPFMVPGQYFKNLNKQVEVILKGNQIKLQGILKAYDGNEILLEYQEKRVVEGKKKKEAVTLTKHIPIEEIKQIKDIITF